MNLIAVREACPLLACSDPRTALRRIDQLNVGVVVLSGRRFVDRDELDRALRAARGYASGGPPSGVTLRPGERLWD